MAERGEKSVGVALGMGRCGRMLRRARAEKKKKLAQINKIEIN